MEVVQKPWGHGLWTGRNIKNYNDSYTVDIIGSQVMGASYGSSF